MFEFDPNSITGQLVLIGSGADLGPATQPCEVLANDVRDAAREQVESMGAEFIAVAAQGIAGSPPEGVGSGWLVGEW